MARIRSIKPEFFDSPSLAKISRSARYLFAGLFTLVDDDGRVRDLPKKIAGEIFPYDDDVDAEQVNKWLDDLERVGSVVRYQVDGDRYLSLPEWRKHQKIDHPTPSRLPGPNKAQKAEESLVNDGAEVLANDSRKLRENIAPDLGSRIIGTGSADSDQPLPEPRKRGTRAPDSMPISVSMRDWAAREKLTLNLEAATEEFLDYWRGVSGPDGVKRDWEATWRNGMRSRQRRVLERGGIQDRPRPELVEYDPDPPPDNPVDPAELASRFAQVRRDIAGEAS